MPTITIKTAEAPIEVMTFPMGQEMSGGKWTIPVRVEPESEHDVELDVGLHLRIRPLPLPAAAPEPAAEPVQAEPSE